MFFDTNYLLLVFIPTLILSGLAQMYVKSAYSKWSNTRNTKGLTGVQVAEQIFARTDVAPVRLEGARGQLSDHFDPRANVVRLSEGIAMQPSVASMAVVAHELGHVQQYQHKSPLITARQFLVPAVQLSPTVGYMMIIFGLMLNITGLAYLGVALFGLMVVFMLLTLPVEIDASRRAIRLLDEAGLFGTEQDKSGAKNMLTAAAMTYLAAAVTAILQLLYYLSLVSRSRR
jgi:uncharacterized protein